MKNLSLLILTFSLILLSCDAPNEKDKTEPTDFHQLSENLEEYFNTLKTLKQFNGGVLVQQRGHRILYEVYNMEEDPTSSLRVNLNAQFDIHSISKLMAKAVVVNLEKKKLIDRNDTVQKYIPDFPKGEIITIQQLLQNQSGLPRGFSKEYPNLIDANPETIIEYIKQEPLLFVPGAETLYSNLGYQVLYFIISKIKNKPFVQVLDEEFLQPLEMKHTGAHFHLAKNNLTQLVKNHELDDGELTVVPNIQSDGKNQAKIYSTLEDLMKFINHVKEEPYRTPLKNRSGEIGWSGGGDGILSHANAALKSDYEIVFFSNFDEIPFGEIVETVGKIMRKEPYDLPEKINRVAIEVDKNILQKYVGQYQVKEFNNNIFEFRMEENKLVFYQDGERNSVLNAETNRTFFDEVDAADYFEFRETAAAEYELIFHYKKMEIKGEKINATK